MTDNPDKEADWENGKIVGGSIGPDAMTVGKYYGTTFTAANHYFNEVRGNNCIVIGRGLYLEGDHTLKYGDHENNVTVYPDGRCKIIGDPIKALNAAFSELSVGYR